MKCNPHPTQNNIHVRAVFTVYNSRMFHPLGFRLRSLTNLNTSRLVQYQVLYSIAMPIDALTGKVQEHPEGYQ
jgi:hypothetical protein